jgi:hypothetical protein
MATDRIVKGALPRVEWAPVITGVLCALAIHIVLGLFGTAFGLAAEPADSRGVGFAAGIWGLFVPFIASAIGAFIAVRIARREDVPGAHLHGALVWAIGLIAGALFITGTMATSAMTSATAASGNLRGSVIDQQARSPSGELRAEDAARNAAVAAGAGALGALLGLAGAFAGAAAGRRALTGEAYGGWRITRERRYETAQRAEAHATSAHGTMPEGSMPHSDRTGVMSGTRSDRGAEISRPGEDPAVHH